MKTIFATLLVLCIGCAATQNPRINSNQSKIDNLKRELVFLKEQNSQLRREIEELKKPFADQNLLISQNRADFSSQFVEITQKLEALQNQIQESDYRFSAFVERNRQWPRGRQPTNNFLTESDSLASDSTATAVAIPPQDMDRSRELYNTAYRDLNRGNYQLALQSFRQFLQQYPNTDLSDDAQYSIGEILYDQGRFANSIEEFEKVLKWYRDSDKVPAALLKIGYAYISMQETDQGRLYLEEVIRDYPDSREANLAKGRMDAQK